MEFVFPWPVSQGEWLAWFAAVVTIFTGLSMLIMPRRVLKIPQAGMEPARSEIAVGEVRASLFGFYSGIGLACILLAQPLLYLALGLCWALTAFGRLVSLFLDRGNFAMRLVRLVIELIMAVFALAFVFGLVP